MYKNKGKSILDSSNHRMQNMMMNYLQVFSFLIYKFFFRRLLFGCSWPARETEGGPVQGLFEEEWIEIDWQ